MGYVAVWKGLLGSAKRHIATDDGGLASVEEVDLDYPPRIISCCTGNLGGLPAFPIIPDGY